jgi:esterase/lipase superfamily enzyme
LHVRPALGTTVAVDERDTTIVMETLFDIRRAVYDIHEVVFPPDDEDEDGAEEKREMSREERAAELRRRDDLTWRLQERIDYHKARLEAADRAQGARRESS